MAGRVGGSANRGGGSAMWGVSLPSIAKGLGVKHGLESSDERSCWEAGMGQGEYTSGSDARSLMSCADTLRYRSYETLPPGFRGTCTSLPPTGARQARAWAGSMCF